MRIELVFPKFKLLSGAERLILGLGEALAEKGHEVRVLCHRFDPSCAPLASRVRVEETGARLEWTGNHYVDSAIAYALALRLGSLIAPDAEVVCLFGPALVLAWRRRSARQRVLYFCYEPPRAAGTDRADVLARTGGWRWLLGPALSGWRAVDHWLVRRVDAVLVNGEYGRERVWAEYGRPSSPITHGVSIVDHGESRDEARAALGLAHDARVAVNLGFLHPRKRVDLLLRSWAEVEPRIATAWLVVVGDGPEAASLHALAARLGLSRVRFCGFVPEPALARCYRAADLLVHVAREETFGLTVVEGGAFALAAVVVDEGGPKYTVRDGETGLRVPAREGDVSAALVSLLGDPERAARMGEAARAHVLARFRWERGADDFLAACAMLGVNG